MPDAQPKSSAEDRAEAILTEHRPDSYGRCKAHVCRERDAMIDSGVAHWTPRHPVVMLAAAGLLVTGERDAQVAGRALRHAADTFPASLPPGMTERDYLRGLAAGVRHGRIAAGGES